MSKAVLKRRVSKERDLSNTILWKASSERLGLEEQYESSKYHYKRGNVSFRSEKRSLKEDIDNLYKAIKFRKNGHPFNTDNDSIFRRCGSEQINEHYVKAILEVAQEIEGVSIFPLYHGIYKKLKGYAVRLGNVVVLFIARNWINPLHNSLLPRINKALYDLEGDLKKYYHVKKVDKVLFTSEIEKKGQKTLDFEVSSGIRYYPLPYISPKSLDDRVKKHTNIDIRKYYPSEENFNEGEKSLLRAYFTKLLVKVKKKIKQIRFIATNRLKEEIIYPIHTSSGLNNNNNNKGGNLEVLAYKPLPDPIFEDPPPSFSSLLEAKREINIEIPEDRFYTRSMIFKKRAKNGIMRTYTKTMFYKVHQVEEKRKFNLISHIFKKHFIINLKTYRLIYGLKKTLNNCIHALMTYRTKNPRKEVLRLKVLKSYKKEMLRIS